MLQDVFKIRKHILKQHKSTDNNLNKDNVSKME